MPNPTVLLCTVGGSHEPIVKSIRHTQPAFICFVCSEDDLATGQQGSALQIEGKGKFIKAKREDSKPSLPNIPTQLELSADSYEVIKIAPDDLDAACQRIVQQLKLLKQRFPDAELIADYTGGTKTMTAALVVAAIDAGVALQVVTGSRVDLVQVRSGMEAVFQAPTEAIRVQREMAPFKAAWKRFAYAEAAQGFAEIAMPQNAQLRAELQIWRDLSRAFDAWDRFDHAQALGIIENYSQRIGQCQPKLLVALRILNDENRPERREALRLFDLWHNAQRRATQGRFDDAVARVYRLLEWTAQWLVRCHLGFDTADVPADRLPEGFGMEPGQDGKIKLGLFQAWRLLGTLTGPVGAFVDTELTRLQDRVIIRNHSILAHGFKPIDKDEWQRFHDWLEHAFLPLLTSQAQGVGIKAIPPQLPVQQCW